MSNVVPLPTPPRRHPAGNRVTTGKCRWISPAPGYKAALDKLESDDRFAWNGLVDQIEESIGPLGLGGSDFCQPVDYQSPLKYAPKGVVNPPWIGELKANGQPPKLLRRPTPMWRLYFGEPLELRQAIIGVCVRRKFTNLQQERDVADAMGLLKRHFASLGHSWAPFRTKD